MAAISRAASGPDDEKCKRGRGDTNRTTKKNKKRPMPEKMNAWRTRGLPSGNLKGGSSYICYIVYRYQIFSSFGAGKCGLWCSKGEGYKLFTDVKLFDIFFRIYGTSRFYFLNYVCSIIAFRIIQE